MAREYSIVIDVPGRTLFLFQGSRQYRSYPVAVGKPSTPTPRGTFTIVEKVENPGEVYGPKLLALSKPYYSIHGTNAPSSSARPSPTAVSACTTTTSKRSMPGLRWGPSCASPARPKPGTGRAREGGRMRPGAGSIMSGRGIACGPSPAATEQPSKSCSGSTPASRGRT